MVGVQTLQKAQEAQIEMAPSKFSFQTRKEESEVQRKRLKAGSSFRFMFVSNDSLRKNSHHGHRWLKPGEKEKESCGGR